MTTSTQSATPMSDAQAKSNAPFRGLTDPNGYDIEYVEFNSPVWVGTGYASGVSVSQVAGYPTDRTRCTFAEIVGENWRFVLGDRGAVLVSNANIKFIWTVASEVSPAKGDHDQESVALPESLRDVAHALQKKQFESHTSEVSDATPERKVEPEPDPAAHFEVVNPPAQVTPDEVVKRYAAGEPVSGEVLYKAEKELREQVASGKITPEAKAVLVSMNPAGLEQTSEATPTEPPKKKRGRPPGAKNKPKAAE